MKKLYLSLLATACISMTLAQNIIPPKYNYEMSDNVEAMEVVPGGILLIGSADGLSGIEAHSDKVLYTYTKMGKIKPEEMQVIPNTTYIILTRGYSKIIIDYTNGKEVFTAADNGWGAIMSITPDFTNSTLVMLGTSTKGGYSLGIYDLETLAEKGKADFTDKKQLAGYINLLSYFESAGKIFLRTGSGLICVDKQKVSTDWAYGELDKTSLYLKVIADPARGEYYIAESNSKNHYLHKVDANGNATTKKPSKLQGMPQRMLFVEQGLLVHTADLKGKTTFQLFDRNSAKGVWKKPFEIKGAIFTYEVTPNGLVFAAHEGVINTIDINTGLKKLKKDIKTSKMYRNVNLLPNDEVFFLSSKEMGVANLKTGEFVKEPAKFKKVTNLISAYDIKNEKLVVSTGTELYFIKLDGTSQKITDIKFKEDETPNKIEFRETGILVSASQNNMLISYDGRILYESYYKAPGQSIAAKIALGALAAAAATQSVGQNMAGNNKDANQSASAANGVAGEMNKKFRATSGTKNHLFILTKLEDGIGLVKLNKDTGKKDAEVILKDKKPEYKVDDNYGILYYKKDKQTIVGYDLR